MKYSAILRPFIDLYVKIHYRSSYKTIIEHMEFDFVISRKFAQRTIRVLDVGAHTGEFLRIFKNANHRHKYEVIAVEPLRENLFWLRLESLLFYLSRRGKVQVLPIGIGKNGVTKFHLGSETTLFTSNEGWKQKFPNAFLESKVLNIETREFSSLPNEFPRLNFQHFDLVKIDCEGSDLMVLKSLANSPTNFDALIIEFDLNSIKEMIFTLTTELEMTEIYAFVRNGIETLHIGNVLNDAHLLDIISYDDRINGNLVAFRAC